MKLFRQSYGEGAPLIILHGLFGASGNWRSLARNSFSHSFRVVSVDLRNHGRSPHSDEFSYRALMDDILELLVDEEIGHAHFLGHSMGGKLAMHLALEHSRVVDKLIIADIAPRAYKRRHDSIFRALRNIDPALFEARYEIDAAMITMIPEPEVRQFLLKNLHTLDGRLRWKINFPAIERAYSDIMSEVQSWNIFEGETLFIRGENSDYLMDSDLPSIRALFPFAQIKAMQNAGHWLHADNPDLFAQIVLGFLD